MTENKTRLTRRKVITRSLVVGGAAAYFVPKQWSKPMLDSVILPAHAQTSATMCVTDTTVGGPLLGNPSGATSCQAACQAEADTQSAQLCLVTESVDSSGATQCDCELDLP